MSQVHYSEQQSDYSNTDESPCGTSIEAKLLFNRFPWSQRISAYHELCKREEDVCPPLVSFREGKNYLNVTTVSNDDFTVVAKISVPTLFGMLSKTRLIELTELSPKDIDNLIEIFFEMRYEQVVNYKN